MPPLDAGTFWATILTIYQGNRPAQITLMLIGANLVMGVGASLYRREFYLGNVGDWILTRALPYLLATGAVQMVVLAMLPAEAGVPPELAQTVWLFAIAQMLGKLFDTAKRMGLDIKGWLGTKPEIPPLIVAHITEPPSLDPFPGLAGTHIHPETGEVHDAPT